MGTDKIVSLATLAIAHLFLLAAVDSATARAHSSPAAVAFASFPHVSRRPLRSELWRRSVPLIGSNADRPGALVGAAVAGGSAVLDSIVKPAFVVRVSTDADADGDTAVACRSDGGTYDIEVLSENPRVYVVRNLLSPEECRAYINRASSLVSSSEGENAEDDGKGGGGGGGKEEDGRRTMTRSNAPEVSLDTSRLWPLPFLCLGAAVPPVLRLFADRGDGVVTPPSLIDIAFTALPPIVFAASVAAALAFVVTELVRRDAVSSSRTSEAVAFNADDDVPLIRPLLDRISSEDVSGGHPWRAFEAPVVTRYRPGAVFARHNDASPTRGSEWSDLGGQRVVTVIAYLNTCTEGGGTHFDRLGITVQPKEGSALVFFPADAQTLDTDDRTRHESLPAVEEKWIVQLFGRVGPRVPPPLGIPCSFGTDGG